jgi:hypothetical protein
MAIIAGSGLATAYPGTPFRRADGDGNRRTIRRNPQVAVGTVCNATRACLPTGGDSVIGLQGYSANAFTVAAAV